MPVKRRCSGVNLARRDPARERERETQSIKSANRPPPLFSPTPPAAHTLAPKEGRKRVASSDTVNCALRLLRRRRWLRRRLLRAWNSLRCFGLASSSSSCSSVGHSTSVADKEERGRERDQTSGESSANKSEPPSSSPLVFPLAPSLPPTRMQLASFTPDGEENAAAAPAPNANFPPAVASPRQPVRRVVQILSSSLSCCFFFLRPLSLTALLLLLRLPVVKLDFPTSSLAAAACVCVSPVQKFAPISGTSSVLPLILLLPRRRCIGHRFTLCLCPINVENCCHFVHHPSFSLPPSTLLLFQMKIQRPHFQADALLVPI